MSLDAALSESRWPFLLEKYDRPVPRYTSYPPAPAWHDDPGRSRRAVEAFALGDVAVYVHVPFCPPLCLFCACHRVITRDSSQADGYIAAIEREADLIARRVGDIKVSWFHWGGGTPNSLTARQTDRLYRAIADRFPLGRGAEVSMEIDPRIATREQIAHLAGLGFNRLSLGVQDFNELTQRAINRSQTFKRTAEVIGWARERGVARINFDLIYGLPHQTRQSFAATLNKVLELRPSSLAVYSYAHVPWVNKAQRSYERFLPTHLEKFGMLTDSVERLAAVGYQQVGIDHFALPGDPLAIAAQRGTVSRSFMGYTPAMSTTVLALGASAISNARGAFVQNTPDVRRYIASVTIDADPAARGCILNNDDLARKQIVDELMTRGYVWTAAIEHFTGAPFAQYFAGELQSLQPLVDDGLVTSRPRIIALTPLGKFFARNVAACFDAYAPSSTGRHASAV